MAQPVHDDGASAGPAAAMLTPNAASRAATPASISSAATAPTHSFQAVNSQTVSQHARVGSPATAVRLRDNSLGLTPPPKDPVAAQSAPPQAQTPAPTEPSSKQPSQPDNSDVAMAETTYGTRSRNRTSTRPNYAEDQEMDFEYSSAATTTTTSKKKAADASAPATNGMHDSKRGPDVTSFSAINSNVASAPSSAKDSTPGNSGAVTTTSKKRKAAGIPTAALNSSAASSTPPPQGARKQAGSAVLPVAREINIMTFTKHLSCLNKKGELVADDGTKLSVNDHVYLVCEPPGDPYYLCRIMEFLHVDSDNPSSPVDSLRVNWYYRPRDVARFSSDTRLVFGTMHSDMCPLTSLRGKCLIRHRSEIEDLDAYRKERDSFYFVQVFDRFIRRSYECIPVRQIINVPDKVKKALDERWKFVVVEISRVKELTSAAKTCKRCARYCASSDSVDCAICKNSYHMNCVQPPLPKKPSRGFAWACGPCSRAAERQDAHSTPTASGNGTEVEEDEIVEEEVTGDSHDTTRAPSPSASDIIVDEHPATQAEIALAKMWPMRYLGIHARVEDALQYDDRAIYPRASSRLGPRHQASVNMWHGRPVELVKPAEIKKRYNKGPAGKKETKLTKETLAAIEADRDEKSKRPKWVQDEPTGYVARGEDYPPNDPRCTAKLIFKMPTIEENPAAMDSDKDSSTLARQEKFVQSYFSRARGCARAVGVPPFGTNFLDKSLELLNANNYNQDAALKQLLKVDRRKDLHEPVFSKSDLVKFEEGVAKYGSEHRLVRLHMKTTLPHSDIVRFYYLWKKTPKGRDIWGNYGGRKKRKMESDTNAKLQAELAHDVDDSAFDNEKAARKNRGFQCKFCNTQHSRQWKRAPGVSPGQTAPDTKGAGQSKRDRPLYALCLRCAGLWRKYAIQWEEIDEVARKAASGGGKAFKKKIDEELLRELMAANEAAANLPPYDPGTAAVQSIEGGEPPKKKSKMDKDGAQASAMAAAAKKEKPPPPPKEPTPPPPPIVPAQPTWKSLPCAVCKFGEDTIACAHCKLTVHRHCFGVDESDGVRASGEVYWICEQCQNDRNPSVSTEYSCCLCLTEETYVDLVEPPRVSHKKKTDREREKERLEKELADNMRTEYRNRQYAHNRPLVPREPLKRTTGNNWVHVYCALWSPEIRFSDAKKLEVAEGVQLIPQQRFEAICKLCKNKDHQGRVQENAGACVNCSQCGANFHASCASEAGCIFGFDVQPVKGSRKDQVVTAKLGEEIGAVTAVIMCKEHVTKGIIHPINEIVDESGKTALQIYAENYKQADLTLTGTVRKAAQAQLTKDKSQQLPGLAPNGNRRESGAHSIAAAVKRGVRNSTMSDTKMEHEDGATDLSAAADFVSTERRCTKCDVDVTPKWHPLFNGVNRPPFKSPVIAVNKPSESPDTLSTTQNNLQGLQPQQNIRFMAPGATGRSWDGMSERNRGPPSIHGESGLGDVPIGASSRDAALPPPVEVNGAIKLPHENADRRDNDAIYHTHAVPKFQNPGARPPLIELVQDTRDEHPQNWLCHKCFMSKKLDPTSPPEERSDRIANSPPKQFPIQLEAFNTSPQPPAQLTIEQQFEVWDRPPPPPTPLPPPPGPPNVLNGYGPSPHYVPNPPMPPPNNGYGHSAFTQQANGYHGGGPPHHGGPPMHERQHNYGYPPHGSPNQPPHYARQSRPPSSPMNGYGPRHNQPLANGMPSSHGPVPPLQSPTYQHSQQPQQQMQPPRGDAGFAMQLQTFAQPIHGSPMVQPPFPRSRPESMNGQPSQTLQQQPAAGSPQSGSVRLEGQTSGPETPRGGQPNGVLGPSGASASPNLMNLLQH